MTGLSIQWKYVSRNHEQTPKFHKPDQTYGSNS